MSWLERTLLPSLWRIESPSVGDNLPDDPVAFVDQVAAEASGPPGAVPTSADPGESDGTLVAQSDLIEMAIQTWRLDRRVQSIADSDNSRLYKQLSDSLRRFLRLLERLNVEFEDPVGKPYTPGWQEVEVVSWDEAPEGMEPPNAGPWISQTVSPIVRRHGVTVKPGQVICVDIED